MLLGTFFMLMYGENKSAPETRNTAPSKEEEAA